MSSPLPLPIAVSVCGVSGRFPSSSSPDELYQLIFSGQCLVSPTGLFDRLKCSQLPGLELPSCMGTMRSADVEAFDHEFFDLSHSAATQIDPQQRKMLEVAYEAIADAGITVDELRRPELNTAVFIGASYCDSFIQSHAQPLSTLADQPFAFAGGQLSLLANRVSYCFGFGGASMTIDTACSSSMTALDRAVIEIQLGRSKAALVGGVCCHNLLASSVSVAAAGFLNQFNANQESSALDRPACAHLTTNGTGFVRSEACCAVLLLSSDIESIIKRPIISSPYSEIVRSLANADGLKFSSHSIHAPLAHGQERLLNQCYNDNVSIFDLAYLEMHGTGTHAGDTAEAEAVDKYRISVAAKRMRRERPDAGDEEINELAMEYCRSHPLLVHSVKSSVGHCEPAAGLVSLIFTCQVFKNNALPANLFLEYDNQGNINNLNPAIEGLVSGRLSVCSKLTPLSGPLTVGISSFGMGGANAHVIIKQSTPAAPSSIPAISGHIPLFLSSRTRSGLDKLIEGVHSHLAQLTDPAAIYSYCSSLNILCLDSFRLRKCPHKAFGLVSGNALTVTSTSSSDAAGPPSASLTPSCLFIFTGGGCQYPLMGVPFLQSPAFLAVVERAMAIIERVDESCRAEFNIRDDKPCNKSRLMSFLHDPAVSYHDPHNRLYGIISLLFIQIGQLEVLRRLAVAPATLIAHSSGEIVSYYAAGYCSLDEVAAIIYSFARANQDFADEITGDMAALNTGHEEAQALLAEYRSLSHDERPLVCACNNSASSTTLSGDSQAIKLFMEFIADKKGDDLSVKIIPSLRTPYHTSQYKVVMDRCSQYCHYILSKTPSATVKESSIPWVSSCCHDENGASSVFASKAAFNARFPCFADYLHYSMLAPVDFAGACMRIASDGPDRLFQCVEIGPNAIFSGIAKSNLVNVHYHRMASARDHNWPQPAHAIGGLFTMLDCWNSEEAIERLKKQAVMEEHEIKHFSAPKLSIPLIDWQPIRFPLPSPILQLSSDSSPLQSADTISTLTVHINQLFCHELVKLFASIGIKVDPTLFSSMMLTAPVKAGAHTLGQGRDSPTNKPTESPLERLLSVINSEFNIAAHDKNFNENRSLVQLGIDSITYNQLKKLLKKHNVNAPKGGKLLEFSYKQFRQYLAEHFESDQQK